jgi:hypothetical protein
VPYMQHHNRSCHLARTGPHGMQHAAQCCFPLCTLGMEAAVLQCSNSGKNW